MNSTDEFLAHFGVKGMKWGHRKSINTVQKAPKKKYSSDEILSARQRQFDRINKINRHAEDVRLASSAKGRASAQKMVDKYANQYVNSKDKEIAAKSTRGEKAAAALVYGSLAVVTLSNILLRGSGSRRL